MSAPVYTPELAVHTQDPQRRARHARTVVALALLGGFGFGVYQLLDLLAARPVEVVRIGGNLERVSRSRLEQAIAPHIGGGLLEVDVDAVRAAAARLPWVRDVSVRRVWPGGMHVSIREREAVARWNGNGLIDRDGVAFVPPASTMPPRLPELEGPPGRELELLARYRALRRIVERAGCGRLVRLRVTARGAWLAWLDTGASIALGRRPSLDAAEAYLRALPRVVAGRLGDVASVDLRYPNGFALRFKPGTQDANGVAEPAR